MYPHSSKQHTVHVTYTNTHTHTRTHLDEDAQHVLDERAVHELALALALDEAQDRVLGARTDLDVHQVCGKEEGARV